MNQKSLVVLFVFLLFVGLWGWTKEPALLDLSKVAFGVLLGIMATLPNESDEPKAE